MTFWEKLLRVVGNSDDFKTQLFAFLNSGETELWVLGRRRLTREDACRLLQEMIPARIEVRGRCRHPVRAVAAAPHVSFDHWSEYFCNRVARRFRLGWVVAKNYRDQDPHSIPAAIGRHVHVNRPTESAGPGRRETHTARAEAVHEEYVAAIAEAGHGLPVDLLLEFHSHHRTPYLEIAATGMPREWAEELVQCYRKAGSGRDMVPELRLEPLHELQLTALKAKRRGSLRPEVTSCGLHIEIPREARQSEHHRRLMCSALIRLADALLRRLRIEANLSH